MPASGYRRRAGGRYLDRSGPTGGGGAAGVPASATSGVCWAVSVDSDDFGNLREALQKLRLNDASLHFEPETSQAMGFGFRCGFLGLLHMEIVQERLEREYNLDLVTTAPTVIYEVLTTGDEILKIDNPAKLPPVNEIAEIREPIIVAHILTPTGLSRRHHHAVHRKAWRATGFALCRRPGATELRIAAGEVVLDFFDRLKSVSRGFGSFEYSFDRFQVAPLVKLDVLINGEQVDSLSVIVHRDQAPVSGSRVGGQAEGTNSSPDVRGRDSGRHRQSGHRPHHRQGAAQERAGQVLQG